MNDCLTDYILARKISREQLTAINRIVPSTLTRVLLHQTTPQRSTFLKLATSLQVAPDAIWHMLKAEWRAKVEDPCCWSLLLAIVYCHAVTSDAAKGANNLPLQKRLTTMITAAKAAKQLASCS